MHLTQGDYDGKAVIVSFVTIKMARPKVHYGTKKGDYPWVARGYSTQYSFYNYTSAFIHHVVVSDLKVLIFSAYPHSHFSSRKSNLSKTSKPLCQNLSLTSIHLLYKHHWKHDNNKSCIVIQMCEPLRSLNF